MVAVAPDGPLADKVQPNDLIVQINMHGIPNTKEFEDLTKIKPGQTINIKLRRGPTTISQTFKLPEIKRLIEWFNLSGASGVFDF